MARKKKITKTAREYDRIMKNIKEQERYYSQRGIKLPEVSAADFGGKTRTGLAKLRKYQKQLKQTVSDIKKKVRNLAKEFGISVKSAYEMVSAQYGGNIPTYTDVAIDNFYKIIDRWATRSSRLAMYKFLNNIRGRVTNEDFAAALKDTAEHDQAMEELLYYHVYSEEVSILQPLLFNILSKLTSIGNLGKDEVRDDINELWSASRIKRG